MIRSTKVYWGIETDRSVGNSDGTHSRTRFFSVKPKMAIFVSNPEALSKLTIAKKKKKLKKRKGHRKTAAEKAASPRRTKKKKKGTKLASRRETLETVEFIGSHASRAVLSEKLKAERGFNFPKMMKFLHRDIVGQGELTQTPFGMKQLIYCDWMESGRQLLCIERYLLTHVSTMYGNTHTLTSVTGTQSTRFFTDSRLRILRACGGKRELDDVIFYGSGGNQALEKMVRTMRAWVDLDDCVVFVSAMCAHTQWLLWKEAGFTVIMVPTASGSGLNTDILAALLDKYAAVKYKIGSFAAASEICGVLEEVDAISVMMHSAGGFVFWDYSAAGPYVEMRMNGGKESGSPLAYADAIMIATHRMMGGPSAPAVLITKKAMFRNPIPVIPAGGTVSMAFGAMDGDYFYHDTLHEREEGGTPDIMGAIRAGLCFSLKEQCGVDLIEGIEFANAEAFNKRVLDKYHNIIALGDLKCRRLPVYSLLIGHTRLSDGVSKMLHHSLVTAMLSDLFGIESRCGVMDNGLYFRYLVGMSDYVHDASSPYSAPGFTRINLHFTMTPEEFEYVCDALGFLADEGWKLVPLYRMNDEKDGGFVLRDSVKKKLMKKKSGPTMSSLDDLWWDTLEGMMRYPDEHNVSETFKSYRGEIDKMTELCLPESLGTLLPSDEEVEKDKIVKMSDVDVDDEDVKEPTDDDENRWYWTASDLLEDVRKYAVEVEPIPSLTKEDLKKGMFKWFKRNLKSEQAKIAEYMLKPRRNGAVVKGPAKYEAMMKE